MDRVRVWLAVSPIVGAGVLLAHALAYTLTGEDAAPLHAYLDHAPQVLVVLALVGACFAALGPRLRSPSARLVPVAALAVFVVQEHLEQLAHTGDLPLLATSPVFLVGLCLQVPAALAAWGLARLLLGTLPETSLSPARRSWLATLLVVPAGAVLVGASARSLPGRGPPSLRRR